eukprot:gene26229-9036_t
MPILHKYNFSKLLKDAECKVGVEVDWARGTETRGTKTKVHTVGDWLWLIDELQLVGMHCAFCRVLRDLPLNRLRDIGKEVTATSAEKQRITAGGLVLAEIGLRVVPPSVPSAYVPGRRLLHCNSVAARTLVDISLQISGSISPSLWGFYSGCIDRKSRCQETLLIVASSGNENHACSTSSHAFRDSVQLMKKLEVVQVGHYEGVTVQWSPGRSPSLAFFGADDEQIGGEMPVHEMTFEDLHELVQSYGFKLEVPEAEEDL